MLEALKTYIDNSEDLAGFPLNSDGAFEIAELLNRPEGQGIRSRFINARTVLAELGPEGAAILDKLETASTSISSVRWAMSFIKQDSGIDVGHLGTQSMINLLVNGGILTADEGGAVKALALQPITRCEANVAGWIGPVTYQQVEAARSL